jgi:hypothetical protein
MQKHIEETKIKKKAKKYHTELRELKMMVIRKKQQLEEALALVEGLQKGLDAARLLSDLLDARRQKGPTPAGEPLSADGTLQGKAKTPKGESNRISLHLFKAGVPVAEIASRRGLALTTVEGHLAAFITTGEISIKELVPEDKIEFIRVALLELADESKLGPVKARLGDAFSFGEIRAVQQHLRLHGHLAP